MPQKYPFTFGINTTIYQVYYSVRQPLQKASWVRPINFSQWAGSGESSLVTASKKYRIFSTLIPYGPPSLFLQRRKTSQDTSS